MGKTLRDHPAERSRDSEIPLHLRYRPYGGFHRRHALGQPVDSRSLPVIIRKIPTSDRHIPNQPTGSTLSVPTKVPIKATQAGTVARIKEAFSTVVNEMPNTKKG